MANPVSLTNQGFIENQHAYDASLNVMTLLPYSAAPNTSIVKSTYHATCPQQGNVGSCVKRYGSATVLDVVPNDGANGGNTFRPAVATTAKKLYTLSDFDFTRVTSHASVSASANQREFSSIVNRWGTPWPDLYSVSTSTWVGGDQPRMFVPYDHFGLNYAANYGEFLLSDVISLLGTEPLNEKQAAINTIVQRGIDSYAIWEDGNVWASGAGQQLGRKTAATFMGALSTNATVRSNMQTWAATFVTQTDNQVRNERDDAVWGDKTGSCGYNWYWNQLLKEQKYDGGTGTPIGSGDNQRTCEDPHDYIDGPSGLPGGQYMNCCSTGNYIAHVLIGWMMPQYATIDNNPAQLQYVLRAYNEATDKLRPWTLPDPCAPPDPREDANNCSPYSATLRHNCEYYAGSNNVIVKTWGPDPANGNQCMPNNSDINTGQNGRFPAQHQIDYANIAAFPAIAKELYAEFKP
jgi:hypothetical protein